MIDLDNLRSYIAYITRNAAMGEWHLGSLINLNEKRVKITKIFNDGSALFDIMDYLGDYNIIIGRIWFNDKYIMLVKNEADAGRSMLYSGWPEDVDLYCVYEKKIILPKVPKGILKIPEKL